MCYNSVFLLEIDFVQKYVWSRKCVFFKACNQIDLKNKYHSKKIQARQQITLSLMIFLPFVKNEFLIITCIFHSFQD